MKIKNIMTLNFIPYVYLILWHIEIEIKHPIPEFEPRIRQKITRSNKMCCYEMCAMSYIIQYFSMKIFLIPFNTFQLKDFIKKFLLISFPVKSIS